MVYLHWIIHLTIIKRKNFLFQFYSTHFITFLNIRRTQEKCDSDITPNFPLVFKHENLLPAQILKHTSLSVKFSPLNLVYWCRHMILDIANLFISESGLALVNTHRLGSLSSFLHLVAHPEPSFARWERGDEKSSCSTFHIMKGFLP